MQFSFSYVDEAIIALYFGGVLAVGFLTARKQGKETVEYLLAGRSLTTPIFVMTLVSSWYGGILGVGEFSYRYGISNWVVQGAPYYVFAFVFAFLLAGRIRKTDFATIPDKLHASYGKPTAVLGAVLTFFLMTPAPYILMTAVLLELLTGWGYLFCVIVGTLASTIYLYSGGFRSDVNTNVFEFILMFTCFAVILPFSYDKLGGFDFIRTHVPPLHLTWNGGNSIQFVVVWFFIALWTLVDPSFHQRCYAAKTPKVAKRGILWSILFWFIFDAMTATAGLYARAAIPDLKQPVMAYPALAELVLPPIAKGLFYVGMFATIMSTLNTLMFVSATTLGRDIVWRLNDQRGNDVGWTKAGLLVAGALSIGLSLAIPSVIKLWYTIGTVIIPGLLVPLVMSYFPRLTVSSRYAFVAMMMGWLVSLTWLVAGWSQQIGAENYPLGVEPMYPGLIASIAVWTAGKAGGQREYAGGSKQ